MAVFITPTALTWVVVGTTQWVTYNLTGIIPTNATGVILNYAQLNGYQNTIQVRKKGSTDSLLPNNVTGLNEQTVLYCGVDSSQNFEFYTEASFAGNQLWVLGYFTSDATFSTNATALAATTAATWTSYNLSSSAPNAIAAIIYLPYYAGAVRKNGSTDAFGNLQEASPGARYFIVGLDSSKICQIFTYTSSVPYLMGYITSGITWNTNAIVRTPATAGSFQSLTAESNATGYLYQLNSPSTFYSYSLSSTTVSGYALNLGNPGQLNGQAPSGGSQAQINIQNTGLAVYEVGYFTNPWLNPQGINFRNSLAYVTDPAGTVGFPNSGSGFNLRAYPYSVTANGATFNCGWDAYVGNEDGARDDSVLTGVAAELAGTNNITATGSPVGIRAFSIQLPAAGTYLIWMALGRGAGGYSQTYAGGSACGIYDGGTIGGAYNSGGETLLRPLTYGTTTTSTWFDAAGNLLNQTNWVASNGGTGGGTPILCTFKTAVCKLVLGTSAGAIAHLRIQQVSSYPFFKMYANGTFFTNGNGVFDEVTNQGSSPPERYTTAGYLVSGILDEVTYNSTAPVIKNLLTYTEQENNAVWGKGSVTITVDSTTDPIGTTTADTIVENTTAAAYHYVNQTLTKPATAITYTYSIYAKDTGTSRGLGINIHNSGGTSAGAVVVYNLSTGATITTAGVYGGFTSQSSTIRYVGNGWYRISLTTTTDASATSIIAENYLYSIPGATTTYTGDGVSGVYVWGAQFELGSAATVYQGIAAANTLVSPGFVKRVSNDGTSYVTNIFDEVTGGYG